MVRGAELNPTTEKVVCLKLESKKAANAKQWKQMQSCVDNEVAAMQPQQQQSFEATSLEKGMHFP